MRVLVLGLYAEGSTGERFLEPVIRRTTEDLLAAYDGGWSPTPVLEQKPIHWVRF
jgi:hypothetical protein